MSNRQTPSRLQLIPLVILLLGLALTYVLQATVREHALNDRREEFAFRVNQIVDNIDRRMTRYEEVLEGAAGLFNASRSVNRAEFATYVEALKLEGKCPGIQGVGFSRLIPPQGKAAHIAAVRAEGFPAYDIRPPGEREVYSAIVYLEPFDWRNQRAFGYDMFSEPVRRTAMVRARDEGRTAISGKVLLLQETERDVQAGILMYLPVYRDPHSRMSVEERRASLIGWVYAPFRMNDLMSGILGQYFGEISSKLDLKIYDGAKADLGSLLYSSGHEDIGTDPDFGTTRTIDFFGRQWTVVVRGLPTFQNRSLWSRANVITVAGLACSILLALVVWQLVTGRARALEIASTMTVELRQSEADLRRLNRSLRLLSDCNMALVHAEDEYRLLGEICRLCVEHGGYLMAWVGYAENDVARNVRPVAHSGAGSAYLDRANVTWDDSERGQGPTGRAIRLRQVEVNEDVLADPRMAPWRDAAIERGFRSSIALPLIDGSTVLGALMMYAREPNAFSADEIKLLKELAGDLAYGIVTLRTRSAHEAAKEQMAFLSHFDSLTHLPNRLLLRDRFEQAIIGAEGGHGSVAMLYLDVDGFQKINDSFGHEVGDRVLVAAVARLRQYIPATGTVSRLSGDEFVALLSGIHDSAGVASAANAICEAFAEPLAVDQMRLNVTFSIGIAIYPGDGTDFDTLLKRADVAVRNAKDAGRNIYRFFTQEMNAGLQEQMRLTVGLLPALRERQFVLHYQPQVDIDDGRLVGAEALIRWQHPQDGQISPARFIPLAEQSGHIIQIGEWVLNEACRQARAWQAQGLPMLVVAVNLSALQFKRGNVLEMVAAALDASGLPPACLELELTESILLQDVSGTMKTLHALKTLGVSLSIDDFGTGYSSLSYLKQLAVDKLKIDQSFVRDMLTDADGASIVRAIIQLGHSLQLTVIAEGVETDAQLAFLGGSGCDEAQGYLLGRPLPAEAFAQLLAQGAHRVA